MKGRKMEKKFWWFSKKNEPASDFEDYSNDYYGDNMREDNTQRNEEESSYGSYSDSDISDVSVVLTGDPSRDKEPLMKRTFSPLSCDDSSDIVDAFKAGRAVVICVEELDKPNFLRLFDYIMGAVQALDGRFDRIDRDTVVLFPYGTDEDVSVDDLEEAEADEETDEDSEDLD